MADDQQTVPTGAQITLRNSPTGGAPGEHSPYYRRLLSAGYKGYLQGVIGGGTLYGLMGAAIGAAIATTLFFTGAITAPIVWALIPAIAGVGLFKGAGTFGNIGSVAAINAESAEMLEERKYLLERYYDLPLSHDYDDEAREIEHLLAKQHQVPPPKHLFHIKTVIVCATLGIAIGVGLAMFAPYMFGALHLVEPLAHLGIAGAVFHSAVGMSVCGAIGGLAGGMIGLDRYYVRKWLDLSEGLVTDPWQIKESLAEKARDTERLIKASPTRGTETSSRRGRSGHGRQLPPINPVDIISPTINTDRPTTAISGGQLESRLADIREAMQRPVV